MRNRPYGEASGYAAILVIPFVYLLIWLFNAHRMGRISKKQYRLYSAGAWLLLIAGLLTTLFFIR